MRPRRTASATAARSGLPGPRCGIAVSTRSRRGRACAGSMPRSCSRSSLTVGAASPCRVAAAEDHGGADGLAPVVVRSADDDGFGDGWQGGQGLLDEAWCDLEAAGRDEVVEPAVDVPAARARRGGRRRRCGTSGRRRRRSGTRRASGRGARGSRWPASGRRARSDRRVRPDRRSVERHAVVDAAAAGLAHAVGRDGSDPRVAGSGQESGWARGAADEDGVETRQRCGGSRRRRAGARAGWARARCSAARRPACAAAAVKASGVKPSDRSTKPGSVPAATQRSSTCTPAMWCGGMASSQAPGPPSRSWVAAALAASAVAGSIASLGVPVEPDVPTTRAVPSSGTAPSGGAGGGADAAYGRTANSPSSALRNTGIAATASGPAAMASGRNEVTGSG